MKCQRAGKRACSANRALSDALLEARVCRLRSVHAALQATHVALGLGLSGGWGHGGGGGAGGSWWINDVLCRAAVCIGVSSIGAWGDPPVVFKNLQTGPSVS